MKQDSYEYWRKQLEQDETRLKELEEKGIKGLSKYDIEIAHMGDAETALETAKYLKRNHLKYDKERIAEFEEKGIQEKLF
jgi:hypothetical protein